MSFPAIHPYLTFSGRCDEALAFYKQAIGAEIQMVMHFNESPEPCPPDVIPPGFEKKVMHASFKIGDSIVMATDGCDPSTRFDGFTLNLTVANIAAADHAFAALADGGQVTMPLGKTFWSPRFGMLKDRFGVSWMVMVPGEMP